MSEFGFHYLKNACIAPTQEWLNSDKPQKNLSETVTFITGMPATLCPEIAASLGEPRGVGITPLMQSNLVHNIQVIAQAVASNRVSFPILNKAETERPGARASIGYAAEEFVRMVEMQYPLIFLPPQSAFASNGKRVLPTKVRVIVNTAEYSEERRNPAIFVLIREWQQAIQDIPKEEQYERLAEIARYGRAWRGLAVVLGEQSGFDYTRLLEFTANDPLAKDLLDSLYPAEKRPLSRKSADELAQKYCDFFVDNLLTHRLQYRVPVTYGMDLDSVVRRTFHERNYKGSANPLDYKQKDEVLDSLGLYFYYDVLDVYQVNLGSLPSRWAGLFDRRKLTGDIVERIHNFISECEYIPALANLPTMISRVLETVAV